MQFIETYYPVRKEEKQVLREPYDYTYYVHKVFLPFLCELNKALQIRVN